MSEVEIERRFTAYAQRIKLEVLPAGSELEVDEPFDAPPPLPCDDVTWAVRPTVRYWVLHGQDNAAVSAGIEKWLSEHGFVATAGADPWEATAPDGVTARLTMETVVSFTKLHLEFRGPCVWPANRPGGPSTTALPSMATPTGPVQASDPKVACSQPGTYVYNTASPPYAGPGPHLAAIVTPLSNTDGYGRSTHLSGVFLPTEWTAWVGSEVDRARIQLVVCVTGLPGVTAGEVTCQFREGPGTFTLHEAVYSVRVLEAATGREVSTFTVPGTQGNEESCPSAVLYNHGDALLRGIDVDAFHGALRPLVEQPR